MVELAGFLGNATGAGISCATVHVFPDACNATDTTAAPGAGFVTTTDASGYWTFSGLAANKYDVRITSGTSVRWRRYFDEWQGTTFQLGDDSTVFFGNANDAALRWATADCSNHALVLALGDTSQQLHITDLGAIATDWARCAGTHPEVAIHSNTTPATDYLSLGNHDGTTATIDVVGGTTLNFDIAGTTQNILNATNFIHIDCNAAAFGTGADSRIFYDGTDTFWDLKTVGNGDLLIALAACFPSPDPNSVHIWAGTAGTITAASDSIFVLEDNDSSYGMELLGVDGTEFQIRFSVPTCARNGFIGYRATATPRMDFRVAGANRLQIEATTFAFQQATTMSGLGTLTMNSTFTASNCSTPATVCFTGGTITEGTAGTHARIMGVSIVPPTITAGDAAVTNTASLYISDAPSASGATNFALWVDSGNVRFDGTDTIIRCIPYTWPAAGGAASTFLQTDADDNLSWVAGTANLIRVGTAVACCSASLTITGLDSTFDTYLITWADIHPVTDGAALHFRVGDSGGVDAGACDYAYHTQNLSEASGCYASSVSAGATEIVLVTNTGGAAGEGTGGAIWLTRPGDGSTQPFISGTGVTINGCGVLLGGTIVGMRQAVITLDRVQIILSCGNIVSGRLTVFGVAHV